MFCSDPWVNWGCKALHIWRNESTQMIQKKCIIMRIRVIRSRFFERSKAIQVFRAQAFSCKLRCIRRVEQSNLRPDRLRMRNSLMQLDATIPRCCRIGHVVKSKWKRRPHLGQWVKLHLKGRVNVYIRLLQGYAVALPYSSIVFNKIIWGLDGGLW